VEVEVRIAETKIHVKTVKPKVGTKPLVAIHVETKEIIIEETNV
jgi:hypothetical protein